MAAKTMPGYYTTLTSILEADDRALPVADTVSLLNRLNESGDFTTLLIQDTVGYEVVKVLNYQGTLAIDRGLSGTTAKRFPVGSCVTFSPSDELLKALSCETDCCADGADTTYGNSADEPNTVTLATLPTAVVGGIDSLLGEPAGFMYINGKKVPYYE